MDGILCVLQKEVMLKPPSRVLHADEAQVPVNIVRVCLTEEDWTKIEESHKFDEGNQYPMVTLYIGDLSYDVTEDILKQSFEVFVPVVSCCMFKHLDTKKLSSASVTFFCRADAERIKATLNGALLMGHPIRISDYYSKNFNTEANLYVKNLHPTINNQLLYEMFSVYGNVLSCKVAWRENKSLRYGYVQFELKEEAERAIDKLNGTAHYNKQLVVQLFKKNYPDRKIEVYNKVYVSNFDADLLTGRSLKLIFQEYGDIKDILLKKSSDGCSACITFNDSDSAKNATDKLNGHEIDGMKLVVTMGKQAVTSQEFEKPQVHNDEVFGRSLYIGNLPDGFTNEDLHDLCIKYGEITSTNVIVAEEHKKVYGFVCFVTVQAANEALIEMNNLKVGTNNLNVRLSTSAITSLSADNRGCVNFDLNSPEIELLKF